jgi:hypothetical protein
LNSTFRDLTASEAALLDRLLTNDFAGRDQIRQQLIGSTVQPIDQDGSLVFRVISTVKASLVKARIPTEGEAEDIDGVTVHFLLHVVNGVVQELEIYKEDNSRPIQMPSAAEIRLSAP